VAGEEQKMKKAIKRVLGAVKTRTKKGGSESQGKRAGDVIGISGARVPKSTARPAAASAAKKRASRPKGIEVRTGTARRTGLRPARVVGGVRGRNR
jgi:hypothetical protein